MYECNHIEELNGAPFKPTVDEVDDLAMAGLTTQEIADETSIAPSVIKELLAYISSDKEYYS